MTSLVEGTRRTLVGTLGLVEGVKVRVVESLQRADSLVRVEGDQALQEVDFELVKCGGVLAHGDAAELRKRRLEVL